MKFKNWKLDKDEIEYLIENTQKGMSRPKLAEHLNISTTSVYRYQKRLGLY